MEINQDQRDQVVQIAKSWLGTPYRHQASVKSQGCDCIGLIRGIYREFYNLEIDPQDIPPYQPTWYEVDQKDPLITIGKKYLIEKEVSSVQRGDILIFRMSSTASAKHCSVLSSMDTMIHAVNGRGVFEVSLSSHWWKRVVSVFAFPENL